MVLLWLRAAVRETRAHHMPRWYLSCGNGLIPPDEVYHTYVHPVQGFCGVPMTGVGRNMAAMVPGGEVPPKMGRV